MIQERLGAHEKLEQLRKAALEAADAWEAVEMACFLPRNREHERVYTAMKELRRAIEDVG